MALTTLDEDIVSRSNFRSFPHCEISVSRSVFNSHIDFRSWIMGSVLMENEDSLVAFS